ncbi:ATP-dependent DNA/RNA helicase DHX36-like isoform X1 [Cylas formicarius]|uniref:ATP-dependent DNA/RNA helicase DHX36-like isoform X1 n=1 Tax=Cylas formicarius TaxID=197179 RepID=UPI00295895B3|nr:ATP-dependent DNA/RNA helicase DHX36-like isoform X1 [Cylas formicarius]
MNRNRQKGGTPLKARGPKRENVRFGKKSHNRLKLDAQTQEACPEDLRIKIDKTIDEFLDDHEKIEYVFPTDLNNLQRKYIHCKALALNLISKSYGKEPNRELHLRKRPNAVTGKTLEIKVSKAIANELRRSNEQWCSTQRERQRNYHTLQRCEKVYGKLQDTSPVVPRQPRVSPEIQRVRDTLPIFDQKLLIVSTINDHQVVIVSSETGSGKTTQIPQYVMEDMSSRGEPCKIICTQPRRISTMAAAERVAYERGESVGNSVGYHIRLESKYGFATSLVYCTVGVFLRNLMCGSECLRNITHVIVDELHERDKLTDFLLICLSQYLERYPRLRLILMSATLNVAKFRQYFKTDAVISVPGRLYPIQSYFLEDVLCMTQYFTPHMRVAQAKLEKTQEGKPVRYDITDDADSVDAALEAYMNFSDEYNYTAHYEEATADLLQFFITEDVPVDYQHSQKGWTALMIAAHLGDMEFISKLCNMGASLDSSCVLGKTPFDYARLSNKPDAYQYLAAVQQHRLNQGTASSTSDSYFLLQLYDMTTPDDFIDYDLIKTLVKYIHSRSDAGSILIFLPGYDEIMQCNDHIVDSDIDRATYRTYFLHSSMNMKDQCGVFKPPPPFVRKIILSTNIAETSITIEDVVFVIDAGKVKEKAYDSYNKMSALQTQWISKACAKQREGRAGRVRPGFCFRLYSGQRFNHMAEERVPEILRVSLEELCLHAKIIATTGVNIYNFLSLAPDPPSANSIRVAIESLEALGALDQEEDLTKLGEYLAQLALEPRLGKMLIYGCIFKCLEPILTLAAVMANRDPFQLPPQANLKSLAQARRRELTENVPSDHLMYLRVFQRWQEETRCGRARQFCRDFFISESTMLTVLEIRRQLVAQLRAIGFVNGTRGIDECNVNSDSWPLVKGIMGAAFYPNVGYPTLNRQALTTRYINKVTVHNSSVCAKKELDLWLFYDELIKNRISFMVKGTTAITPLTVALMCGTNAVYPDEASLIIDDWVLFTFGEPLVLKFRRAMHDLIEKVLGNPWHSLDGRNNAVNDVLRKILELQDTETGLVQPRHIGVRPKFLYNAPNLRRGAGGASNGWIEVHKKGKSPKRPPPRTSRRFGMQSTSVEQVRYGLQDISLTPSRRDPRSPDEEPPYYPEKGGGFLPFRYYCNLQSSPASSGGEEGRTADVAFRGGASSRYGDFEDNPIFLMIRPLEKRNVDIAQSSHKWVFSPQTEKKILHFSKLGKIVYLAFYVKDMSSFMGVAEFQQFTFGTNQSKPVGLISWVYTTPLHKSKTKHLVNPYDDQRPINDALDGMVLHQQVGEELMRIYAESVAALSSGCYA